MRMISQREIPEPKRGNVGGLGGDEFLEARAVKVAGQGSPAIVFVHGFGADQGVWRNVAPAFVSERQVVLFDQMGSGRSLSAGEDHRRYFTLDGYADDLATLLERLDLTSAVVVGHSVAGMIGLLAARRSARISGLVMIASSARYLNDGDYVGGFEQAEVDDLLALMELDLQGWARAMAQTAVSSTGRTDLVDELAYGFTHANPELLRNFARATFLSDQRARLAECAVPTLVLQPAEDVIVPWTAAQHLASHLQAATLKRLNARGHYPQLSAPTEVIREIAAFLPRGGA